MYDEDFVTEIVAYYHKKEEDLPKAAMGAATMIMKDATKYYMFGPYWWAVKKLIIKYTDLDEWFTKDYMDEMTFQRAWHGSEMRTISAAMYYMDQQIMISPCHSVLINGEDVSYTLFDVDAGF